LVLRKCAGCGEIKDRTLLLRIMQVNDTGTVALSPDNKCFGRSVYLCKNQECLNTALKKKRLPRMLKHQINQDVLVQIENVIRDTI